MPELAIVGIGFSCPSTIPCLSEITISVAGSGVGVAPSERINSMKTGLSMVRIFSPSMSDGVLMVRTLLLMDRKPLSDNASVRTPVFSRMSSVSCVAKSVLKNSHATGDVGTA